MAYTMAYTRWWLTLADGLHYGLHSLMAYTHDGLHYGLHYDLHSPVLWLFGTEGDPHV